MGFTSKLVRAQKNVERFFAEEKDTAERTVTLWLNNSGLFVVACATASVPFVYNLPAMSTFYLLFHHSYGIIVQLIKMQSCIRSGGTLHSF